jgi:N-acetylneuraminic acid mutarotase
VAACISRRLFIFGGENVPRVPVDDTVHVFDLDSRQWSAVQPASAAAAGSTPSWPCARVGAAGTACNGKLFVHGGRTEYNHMQTLSDLWAFDASSSTWALIEQQGQAPGPLSYHAMTSCGDFLYIFGGCKTEGRSNELHRFDTTSGAWTQLIAPGAPSPRGGPATVALPDGSVHVLFGYDGTISILLFFFSRSISSSSQIILLL